MLSLKQQSISGVKSRYTYLLFLRDQTGFDQECWPKNVVKVCVIKTATHAAFDHVFLVSRVYVNLLNSKPKLASIRIMY